MSAAETASVGFWALITDGGVYGNGPGGRIERPAGTGDAFYVTYWRATGRAPKQPDHESRCDKPRASPRPGFPLLARSSERRPPPRPRDPGRRRPTVPWAYTLGARAR